MSPPDATLRSANAHVWLVADIELKAKRLMENMRSDLCRTHDQNKCSKFYAIDFKREKKNETRLKSRKRWRYKCCHRCMMHMYVCVCVCAQCLRWVQQQQCIEVRAMPVRIVSQLFSQNACVLWIKVFRCNCLKWRQQHFSETLYRELSCCLRTRHAQLGRIIFYSLVWHLNRFAFLQYLKCHLKIDSYINKVVFVQLTLIVCGSCISLVALNNLSIRFWSAVFYFWARISIKNRNHGIFSKFVLVQVLSHNSLLSLDFHSITILCLYFPFRYICVAIEIVVCAIGFIDCWRVDQSRCRSG